MRDGVVKRGSSFSYVLELGPDPATGKRRQKWVGGFKTRREAKKARATAQAEALTGTFVAPSGQTTAEFLNEWLDGQSSLLAPSTLHSYKRNLSLHVIPHLGALRLRDLDPGHLNKLYSHLLAGWRGGGHGGPGLSARSVRYCHTILRSALADAVRWGRLARNPADRADPPTGRSVAVPEFKTWTAEQLAEFLTRMEGDRYHPLFVMLATTGCRRGEILGLRWSDLDLDSGLASIRQTVVVVQHEVRFSVPKTMAGTRSITLDPGTVSVLRTWKARQAQEQLLMGAGFRDHDLVFPKPDGDPLHPERVSREFLRRSARSGLPRIRLHDIRHTWATLALASGVHPRIVQERMGHSTIAVTLGTYSHTTPVLHRDAADLVAEKFLGR